MGLTRSLNSGASALKANQQKMDVISNNIANSNTIGYKSSRATFVDQFSQTLKYGKSPDTITTRTVGTGNNQTNITINPRAFGGINPMQIGLGVKVGSITNDMSQGILETTSRPLDMALQGSGYFVYNLNGRQVYSRAGAVTRDAGGYLVDSSTGAYLQGYNPEYDANGAIVKDSFGNNILNYALDNLRIPPNYLSAPKQTENVSVTGNLNSSDPIGNIRETSIRIYDNQGEPRNLNFKFEKVANNQYTMTGYIDGQEIGSPFPQDIYFNNDGTLDTNQTTDPLVINAADLNTLLGNEPFDATKTISVSLSDPNARLSGSITQYSGPNTATASKQDGYTSGDFQGVRVSDDGQIIGSFTNGQSEVLGQVVIAKFTNDQGLIKEGDNFFTISPNSGLPALGLANREFLSTSIKGSTLETSNVDLTDEFVNMIQTQRAFEAASRTVTVSDSMLAETNQLKR